ncbi:MAG: beta strand repeat-containing protein [Candidatus Cryosericum sp.]
MVRHNSGGLGGQGDAAWICVTANTGNAPDPLDATYWQIMAVGGMAGATGATGPAGPSTIADDLTFSFGGHYWHTYASAATSYQFWSTNVDGAGTNGIVWSVLDGTDDVSFGGSINVASGLITAGSRILYNAAVNGFTDSIFIGDGGQLLSHSSGSQGYYNVGFGVQCLNKITEGYFNSAFGGYALQDLTTGYNCMAIGGYAGADITTGTNNIAIGYSALRRVTTTSGNIGIGLGAGWYLADGSTGNATPANSVYIGYDTRAFAAGGANEVVIGANAIGGGSNTVTLGNTSVVTTYLHGMVYVNGGARFYNADAAGFTGSYFLCNADGGDHLTHSAGSEGYYNIGIGPSALQAITTGYYNFGLGPVALQDLTSGHYNIAIGAASLGDNQIYHENTGIGYATLRTLVNGSRNVAVGSLTARLIAGGITALTTVADSTYIGAGALASANGVTNETVIGCLAIGSGSNTVTLGSTAVVGTYLRGRVNATGVQVTTTADQEATPAIASDHQAAALQTGANTGADETIDHDWEAIKFTASGNHNVRSFAVSMKGSGTFTNPDHVFVGHLYTDVAGAPGAKVGTAYATLRFGTLTASYAEVEFSVGTGVTLVSGTSYWLVLQMPTTATGASALIQRSSTGTALYAYSANGAAWTTENNKAGWFALYGRDATAVQGTSRNSAGVRGTSINNAGVYGDSENSYGVCGYSVNWSGVYGYAPNTLGIFGESVTATAIKGSSVSGYGVQGVSVDSYGLQGTSTNSFGIHASSTNNYAGYFVRNTANPVYDVEVVRISQYHTDNNDPALVVQQRGTGDILSLYDNTTKVAAFKDGGDVDLTGIVKAGGYKSSDGTAGWTGDIPAGSTIHVKNGLITGYT